MTPMQTRHASLSGDAASPVCGNEIAIALTSFIILISQLTTIGFALTHHSFKGDNPGESFNRFKAIEDLP